jgi:hypothetical protein
MREAGEIVAKEMAAKAPKGDGGAESLASSFGVWQAKRESRRYRAVIFKVGLKTNFFYSTLAKGRKAHTRKGHPVRGSAASHPGWKLPGEDEVSRQQVIALARSIFNGKVRTVDQMIGRGKRRR